MINRVLDFDNSKTEGRTVPKPGINEELDELRETYDGLGSFLVRLPYRLWREPVLTKNRPCLVRRR